MHLAAQDCGRSFEAASRFYVDLRLKPRARGGDAVAATAADIDSLAATIAAQPIQTRDCLRNFANAAYFYNWIDRMNLRGPLRWEPPGIGSGEVGRALAPFVDPSFTQWLDDTAETFSAFRSPRS